MRSSPRTAPAASRPAGPSRSVAGPGSPTPAPRPRVAAGRASWSPSFGRTMAQGRIQPAVPHHNLHVVGFDDGPFDPGHRGDVLLVGAVFAGPRLDGVLSGKVRRDGANATRVLAELTRHSRFFPQLHAVLLQGIAFAGFNVVDLPELNRRLGLPVIVVCRRKPDLTAVREALLGRVPGGARKWRLVQRAGPMEKAGALHIQCAGISPAAAARLLAPLCLSGALPEPLRAAHLIAGGLACGESTG